MHANHLLGSNNPTLYEAVSGGCPSASVSSGGYNGLASPTSD